ncbi:MAG: right-handed parallel beta-helix repeat-containing protein [Candidatus Hermodarchaeota archaeon]
MKKRSIIIIALLFLGSFIFSTITQFFPISTPNFMENDENLNDDLRSASYWELDYIHIHNNWSETAAQYDWCSGDGSWSDPYLIQNVRIDGNETRNCLLIQSTTEYFTIRNCTFTNSGDGEYPYYNSAIWLNSVRNGKIENSTCSFNNHYGIYLHHSHNNTILNNRINNNIEEGIFLFRSNNNKVINNTLNNNYNGIRFRAGVFEICDNNFIYGNTARYNTFVGLEFETECEQNIFMKNDFSYNGYHGVKVGPSKYNQIIDNVISYNNWYGIYCNVQPADVACRFNNISKNDISNNYKYGISMGGYTNDFYLYENIISENGYNGIEIEANNYNYEIVGNYIYRNQDNGLRLASDGNLISQNIFSENNGHGVIAYSNNNISHNIFQGNTGNGIAIGAGSNNLISNNTILSNDGNGISIGNNDRNNCTKNYLKGNNYGLVVSQSDFNQFSENIFNNNVDSGVYLSQSSNNTFYYNTFSNNNLGVNAISGSNNLFYYNFFTYSTTHAFDSGTAKWDNNTIGNYWDDYGGYDNNGDGIGDTPYVINQSPLIQDRFPIWDILDTESPVIVIHKPESNFLFGLTPPTFKLSINEYNLSQCWYSLNGGLNFTFTGLNGTINQGLWDSCEDGLVLITFYANDSVDNLGYKEVAVIKDSLLPEITIYSPQTLQIFGIESPIYNVSIFNADLNTSWYSLNDGANFTFIGSTGKIDQNAWETCGNGTVKITFYANNSKSNIAYSEVIVQRNTRVPIISIISPSPFSTFGRDTFSFEIDVDEPVLDTTWYSLNGGTNYTFIGSIGIINQEAWDVCGNGTVIIRFYANNSLGNSAFTEFTVYKDIISPYIVVISPSSFEICGNYTFDYEIFIDDPDLNSTWYNLNGGMNYSFTEFIGTIDPLAWDLCGNGIHLLRFYANDTFGNTGFAEVTIQKDILLPLLIINLPYDNQSCGPLAISFELTLIGSDIHTRWYTLNDLYMNEFSGTMGRIDQQSWDNFGAETITIKFYANNSAGNYVIQEVFVIKRLDIVSSNAYAIIIGIANYPGTGSDLSYCDDDADAIYNMLINDYNFLPSNIILIKDSGATKSAIDNAFANINSKIHPDDIFYFYYSGHGGSEIITSVSTYYLNSPHPYPNNYDQTWYITASDAAYIRVHFSDFDLEYDYDNLYIGDTEITQGYYYQRLTGYGTDFWSDWIPVLNDNRIYLRMITDSSVTYWGFRIDSIEVMRYSNPHYMCPYDSLPSSPSNYYLDTLLDAKLDSLNCDNIFAIIDACNSGGLIPESQGVDRFIMTACRDGQVSYEDSSLQHGIFSYYLINSLDNANDQNSDGVISMEECFSYISLGTRSYSASYGPGYQCHPELSDGVSGQSVLYPSIASVYINPVGHQLYYSFYLYGHGILRTLNLSVCSIFPTITFKTEEIKYLYVSPTGFGYYAGVIELEEGCTLGGIQLLAEIEGNSLVTINLRYGDSDGDGLTDFFEIFDGNGLDPSNNDTDGDNISDGDELYIYNTDPLDVDSDSDGLLDGDEVYVYFTDPLNNDSDSDGLTDGEEINDYSTDPLNDDTDSDTIPDGWEVDHSLDPITNDTALDPDMDLLINLMEYQYNTHPFNNDTDSDGLMDGIEVYTYDTDPTIDDTDSDGLLDGEEVKIYNTDPLNNDSDSDGLLDGLEVNSYGTDPLNDDTDFDTMPDYWEVVNSLDPLVNDTMLDPDLDNLINIKEYSWDTDPQNPDTDGDNWSDGDEVLTYGTDPLDPNDYPTFPEEGIPGYEPILIIFTLVFIIPLFSKKVMKVSKK